MAFVLSAQHLDVPLTYRVVQFPMEMKFVGMKAFPASPSDKLSNKIWVIDETHQLRLQNGVAGPNGLLPRVHYRTKDPLRYQIFPKGWEAPVGNIEEATTDEVLQHRRQQVAIARQRAITWREYQFVSTMRDTSVVTQNTTLLAGGRWDDIDSASSDPLKDAIVGRERIKRKSGLEPNLWVIPEELWNRLKVHKKLIYYAFNLKSVTSDRQLTTTILEDLVGLPAGSIYITDAQFDKSSDGPSATAARRRFFGPDSFMGAIGKGGQDGVSDNSFGYGYYLQMLDTAGERPDTAPMVVPGNEGLAVFSYPIYEIPAGGQVVQVVSAIAPHVQNANAAFLWKNAANPAGSEYDSYLAD